MSEDTARSRLKVVDAAPTLIGADEGGPVEVILPEDLAHRPEQIDPVCPDKLTQSQRPSAPSLVTSTRARALGGDRADDVVIICEHASNRIPVSLNALGLDDETLQSHVAWDPGAAQVARHIAMSLSAPLILQRFSRLVYDCNRPPEADSAMPARSEVFDIPGNAELTEQAREMRTQALYRPFRGAVAKVLDRLISQGRMPSVVTIHSFTPVFHGRHRSVELGLLHDVDSRLADAMLAHAADWTDLDVRRNQPYGPEDGVTHTLRVDAVARRLPNVMVEIRNDLIATPAQQSAMAARLVDLVRAGLGQLRSIDNSGARRATR